MEQNIQNPFSIQQKTLENGLQVTVVYRQGFRRMSAQLAFPFGSLHSAFQNSEAEQMEIAAGTAHFLEHQMFKQADGSSISDAFASLGAYDNAFTNFDHTVYMADCSENQAEVLSLLLRYTDQPYFESESVENEKDIIVQELMMYRDQPEEHLEINLRRGLYGKHRAGEDIGGTEESVRQVTPELLYACYDAFYQPCLAHLVVVGDLQPEEVYTLAESWGTFPRQKNQPVWPQACLEAGEVQEFTHRTRAARPLIALGYGDYHREIWDGSTLLRRQLELDLLLDMLFGRSSEFYWQLLEDQKFDSYFQSDYMATPYFAAITLNADSRKPQELQEEIRKYLSTCEIERVLTEQGLARMKRKTLGEWVSTFENGEELAINLVVSELYGYRFIDIPKQVQQIELCDLLNRYHELLQERSPVLSFVIPNQSGALINKEDDELEA